MKIYKKGYVKILLLIIILLIVGGGFYFVFYKKAITIQINSLGPNNFNSYTSPDGLFSLKYPATWIPSQGNIFGGRVGFTSIIPSSDNDSPIAFFVMPDMSGNTLNTAGGFIKKGPFYKIDGYLTDEYIQKNAPRGGVIYVINVGQYETMPINIIAGFMTRREKSKLTESEYSKISSEVEKVVRSITINKDKIQDVAQIQKNALDEARNKGNNAAIKATLSNMRAMAELYYDKDRRNSYSGFCKSEKYLKEAKSVEGKAQVPMVCRDAKENYVISSTLIDEGFFCVDSGGTAKNTKAMDTKNACAK